MRINFSPIRMDEMLSLVREGDVLRLNGKACDLGPLLEGATLPAAAIGSRWVSGQVDRLNGELHLTLVLPHGASAPESTRYPYPLTIVVDGPVTLPVHDISQDGASEPVDSATEQGSIIIDWSQMITAELKQAAAAAELLASVQAETARLRKIADDAIAPLQDAMDLGEATAEEGAELTAWKRYRVALSRLPDQPGYPKEITWPAPPA